MKTIVMILVCVLVASLVGCNSSQHAKRMEPDWDAACEREAPFVKRPFIVMEDGRWLGNGICYGPHRDGQSPDGASPTREQLLEDLLILSKHWQMLRMYGSQDVTEDVLQLIREHDIDMKVVVGAWIATEARVNEAGEIVESFPETKAANRAEVATAIRLANEYPDVVAAVTVGNETHVSWSFHKVRTPVLVDYIRRVRANTTVPVSTADVFSYWARPESKALADEVDFIVTHIYAMWNGQQLEQAMDWTREQYEVNVLAHPDHKFVIGEAGWATQIHKDGDDGKYIKGDAGEDSQEAFYSEFVEWTRHMKIPYFYFEAFDEKWKGGDHPDGAEKHWGLYNSDRTPKKAIAAEE